MAINGGNINFQVNMSVGKSDLSSLIKPLQQIQTQANGIKLDGVQDQLLKAADAAKQLESILNQSWNNKLGQLNLSSFNQGITSAFTNVEGLRNALNGGGEAGRQAFNNLAHTVLNTNVQLKESNTLLDQMATSMANTVKWGITSSIFKTITGSIQQAFNYTKNLDTSLTNIRIVTGASADEMDRFAVAANKSAQELGRSTLEYTKAATSYYQQGLSDEDVKARTEITMKAQNITGAGVEMVDYLTSVWNGFKVTTDEAESYVDKLAKVADSSASDMSQLATAMSKVAATANIMGVDVDQLSAQLATVIATTRQAPEAVGTAFKTIFTRLNDIKTGADDAEISLGKYSGAMASLGFNVLDANGQLRDTGQVMEQIGSRWGELTKAQQVYLASTMGGQRQITQLIALFDNWTRYSDLLNVSLSAQGTLDEKNSRYLDSMAAHMQKLTTQAQRTYDVLFDTKTINSFTDMFRGTLTIFNDYIAGIGGGTKAFVSFGAIVANIFNKQIGTAINNQINSFERFKNNLAQKDNLQKFSKTQALDLTETTHLAQGDNVSKNALNQEAEMMQKTLQVRQGLTQQQFKNLQNLQQQVALEQTKIDYLNQGLGLVKEVGLSENISAKSAQDFANYKKTELDLQKQIYSYLELSLLPENRLTEDQFLRLNNVKEILKAKGEEAGILALISAEQNKIVEDLQKENLSEEERKALLEKQKALILEQEALVKKSQQAADGVRAKEQGTTKELEKQNDARKRIIAQQQQQAARQMAIQKAVRMTSGILQSMTAIIGGISTATDQTATAAERANGAWSALSGGVTGVVMAINPMFGMLASGAMGLAKAGIQALGLWDDFEKIFETNKEKIAELDQTYHNAVTQQKQSNKNISNLQGLQEQWDKLSAKAGEYGKNINKLTDEEKDRYYQLIDTFSQYNDRAIVGYDRQGKAIVAKNDLLKETIELLKEQSRQRFMENLGDPREALAAEEARMQQRRIDLQKKQETTNKAHNKEAESIGSNLYNLYGNVDNALKTSLSKAVKQNVDVGGINTSKIVEVEKIDTSQYEAFMQSLEDQIDLGDYALLMNYMSGAGPISTLDQAEQYLNNFTDAALRIKGLLTTRGKELNIPDDVLSNTLSYFDINSNNNIFKELKVQQENIERLRKQSSIIQEDIDALEEEFKNGEIIDSTFLMQLLQNWNEKNGEWKNLIAQQDENQMQEAMMNFFEGWTWDKNAKSNKQAKIVSSLQDLLDFAGEYAAQLRTTLQKSDQIIAEVFTDENEFDLSKITGSFANRYKTILDYIQQIVKNIDPKDFDQNKKAWQTALAQMFNLEPGSIKLVLKGNQIQIDGTSLKATVTKSAIDLSNQIKTQYQEFFDENKNFNLFQSRFNLVDFLQEYLDPSQLQGLDFDQFATDFIKNYTIAIDEAGRKIKNDNDLGNIIKQSLQAALNIQNNDFELHPQSIIDTDSLIDKLKNTKQLKDEEDSYLVELQSQNSYLQKLSQQVGRNDAAYINALREAILTQNMIRLEEISAQKQYLEGEIKKSEEFLKRDNISPDVAAKEQENLANLQGQLNNATYQQKVLTQQNIDLLKEEVDIKKDQLKASEQQYKEQQKLSQSGKELSKNLQKEDYALTESDYDLIGQYAAKHAEIGETLKQFGPYSQEFADALSKAAEEEEKITEESKEALLTDLERQKAAYQYEEWEYNALNLTEKAKAAAEKRAAIEGEIAKLIAEANGQLEKTLGLKEAIAQADKNERDNQTEQAERDRDEALDRMEALESAQTTSRKLQKREQDNSLSKEDFYNMQAFEAAHPQMQGQFGTDDYTAQFAKWAKNTYNIISAQNQVKEQAIAANQTLIDNTEKSLKEIEEQLINKEDYEAARKRLQAQQILNNKEASSREKGFATQTLDHYGYGRDKGYTQEQQDQDLQLVKQYNDQESLRDQRTNLLNQKQQAEYTQKEIASKQTVSTRDADVTADAVADKIELLQNKAEEFNLSDELLEDKQALEDLAEEIARYDSAMERATKNVKEWKEALENDTATSETVDELKNAYADLLGVAEDSLPEAFVKSAENAQLLEDEVNQIEGAYQQLQNNYHKELLIEMGLDESSAEAVVDEVNSLIDQYHIDDIEVGASLDGTDFSNALAQILSNTYSTVDAAQAALLGLGFNGTVTEDTTTGEETNEFPQSQVTLEDNTMDYVVPQLTAGPIPGDTMGQTMAQLTGAPQTATMHIPEVHTKVNPVPEETTKEQKSMAFKIEGLSRSSGGDIKHKATSHKSPSSGGRGGGGCFIAGTPVSVLDGYKNIEDIKKGDIVLSYNTQFNRVECSMVLETMIHNVAESIYTLYIEDEQLIVTGIHKFLITRNAQKDWIQASDLRKGDLVLFADGTWHEIHKISIHFRHTLVYNFEVLENHNYFVGKNQILAHNKGGGGGGSAKKAQKIDKPKNTADRYRGVNKKLKSASSDLKKLQDEHKKTFGKDSIKNLEKQLDIIKDQVKYTKQKLKLAQQEQKERQEELKKQGVKFFSNGQISNYKQVTDAAYKEYADFVAKYNKASGEWQEENKETLDELKKNYDKLISDIGQYDALTQMMTGLNDDLENFANQEIQLKIDKLNLEVELKLDTQQAQRQFEDFRHRIMKRFSDSNLQERANFDTRQMDSYLKENGTIDTQRRYLDKLLRQRQKMETTGEAPIYGKDRKQLEDDIKQASENLQDSLEEVYSYYEDLDDIQTEYLEHTKDLFDAQNQLYDVVNSELQHELALIQLVYGDQAYERMNNVYTKQLENSQQQIKALKIQQDYYKQQMQAQQNALKSAGYKKGTVQYDKAIERIQAYKQEWLSATQQVNAAVQNAVQLSMQKYQNAINSTFASWEKQLTGGKSLSYVGEEWQLMKKQSDMYLDNVNAIYQTDKLENAFKQAIRDNTGNLKVQKQLNEAMETQLSYLREKEKLTQYDIDRANKLLDIEVKRAALEQASQSKTQLRLRRDSQGNYSYQYAANQDDIANAAQQLEDARNDLYNFTKEAYQKNLDDYYSTFAEMQEKMKAVYLDTTLSAQEREKKIAFYQQYYGQIMYDYTKQNEQKKQDTTIETMRNLAYAWEKHDQDLIEGEDNVTISYSNNQAQRKLATDALIKGVQEAQDNHNTKLGLLYDANKDKYIENQDSKKSKTKDILEGKEDSIDTLWGKSVTALEGRYGTDVTNFQGHLEKMATGVKGFTDETQKDSMPALFKTAFADLDLLETNAETEWQSMIDTNTKAFSGQEGFVPGFKSGVQEMADKFAASIKSMQDRVNPKDPNSVNIKVKNIFGDMQGDASSTRSKFEWVFKKCRDAGTDFEKELKQVQKDSGQDFKKLGKGGSDAAKKVEELVTQTGLLSTVTDGFSTQNLVTQLLTEKQALDQVVLSMKNYQNAHKINKANASIANAQVKEEENKEQGSGSQGKKRDLTDDNLIGIAALIANDLGTGNHGGWGDKTQTTGNGISVRAMRINSKFNAYKQGVSAATAIADLVSYFVDRKPEYGVFSQKELEEYRRRMQQSIDAYGLAGQRSHYAYDKFDTGGYTGAWGKSGRLAMLHEKELVLNKEDTKNILNAVQVNRKIADLMNNINNNNLASQLLSKFNERTEKLDQNVTITATFPNVSSSIEIEKAFDNLTNRASQYALRR